jgi:hypoxanthine phosphoribosyltransferase
MRGTVTPFFIDIQDLPEPFAHAPEAEVFNIIAPQKDLPQCKDPQQHHHPPQPGLIEKEHIASFVAADSQEAKWQAQVHIARGFEWHCRNQPEVKRFTLEIFVPGRYGVNSNIVPASEVIENVEGGDLASRGGGQKRVGDHSQYVFPAWFDAAIFHFPGIQSTRSFHRIMLKQSFGGTSILAAMSVVKLLDRSFETFIEEDQLRERINALAASIHQAHAHNDPLFIAILNGSFIFAADLFRKMDFPCSISFIRVASYAGTASSGKVAETIGLSEDIRGRHIIIVEDIIDTGTTIRFLLDDIESRQPASISIATLLLKRDCLKVKIEPEFVGFEVPDAFLLGYGLDYDGYGRNLPHIYKELSS